MNNSKNKIIGLSLTTNIAIDKNKENVRDIYEKLEYHILNYIYKQKGITFIDGKCELIREDNDLGIKKVK